jgi:hypothetical protein
MNEPKQSPIMEPSVQSYATDDLCPATAFLQCCQSNP